MDKTERKLTKSTKPLVNPLTGLTPAQEQCALLLATGEKVSAVADKVKVSRTTIYQWHELITFQCYMNQLRDEVQRYMSQSLLGMTEDALKAIKQTINSSNEALSLKASIWLIERIASLEIGQCNPYKVAKDEATYLNWGAKVKPEFHQSVYQQRLKELGLKDIKA